MPEPENHTLHLLRKIERSVDSIDARLAKVEATLTNHGESLAHLLDRLPEIAADSSANEDHRVAGAARDEAHELAIANLSARLAALEGAAPR